VVCTIGAVVQIIHSCCPSLQLSKAVEKAIKTSPLSLNATAEGSEVLVKLPRMTQETIDKMVKLVHMEVEGAHQSIRRARQKGMDAVKKAFKSASQDEKKRQEKEVRMGLDTVLLGKGHMPRMARVGKVLTR
jgi:ribosome recycling factor